MEWNGWYGLLHVIGLVVQQLVNLLRTWWVLKCSSPGLLHMPSVREKEGNGANILEHGWRGDPLPHRIAWLSVVGGILLMHGLQLSGHGCFACSAFSMLRLGRC